MSRPAPSLVVRCMIALSLVVSLAPSVALADEVPSGSTQLVSHIAQDTRASLERVRATGSAAAYAYPATYAFVDDGDVAPLTSYPMYEKFDLRDRDVVTPVKLQNPWGTCWGFGAIAASETSILSELGWGADDLDLSELHLAWFSHTSLPLDDESGQGGEGYYTASNGPNDRLDTGGLAFTATSVFSSGIGPVLESDVPYRNKEGITVNNSSGTPVYYSREGDWSVDESLRFMQAVELQESSILPSPAGKNAAGEYEYNASATAALKGELLDGRAISVAFCADTSRPGQEAPAQYVNVDTYAHYTYDDVYANHVVTIVGWDDTYSKSNFLEGHQPPADGAWIAKNSWGSSNGEFPNKNKWGIDDSGYFYLSYYDHSLTDLETFDYDTTELATGEAAESYYLNQYDYLPSDGVTAHHEVTPVSMANVFESHEDQIVRALSCETATPGTEVTYEVYLLNDGFTNPRDGELLTTVSRSYAYGGFHRIDLKDKCYIPAGQKFSVVVTEKVGDQYAFLVDSAINKNGYDQLTSQGIELTHYNVGVVNPGESFVYTDGEWIDWHDAVADIKAATGNEADFDNFPLKAYSDPIGLPPSGFSDVQEGEWYSGVIDYAVSNGIMHGYAGTDMFGPNDTLKRQDLACLLFNYLAPEEAALWQGEAWKDAVSETPFVDAQEPAYYVPALNWAYKAGVFAGYDDGSGRFGVGDTTSREQLAVVMMRAAQLNGVGLLAALDDFPDAGEVSEWARESMSWCVQNGLITGSDGKLLPVKEATRAETAKMISVFDQLRKG